MPLDVLIAKTALEWWRCQEGPRTRERMAALVSQGADLYAIPAERKPALVELAWNMVLPWEREKYGKGAPNGS